jgi:hypothetical protein
MIEVEIGDRQYRSTRKLVAMDQFYVSKRLVPMMQSIVAARAGGADKQAGGAGSQDAMLSAFVDGIAKIPDDDCQFIIAKCLRTVQVKQADGWQTVWASNAAQPQFEDMGLDVLLQLTYEVLVDNLGGFIPGLPSPSSGPPPNPNGQSTG